MTALQDHAAAIYLVDDEPDNLRATAWLLRSVGLDAVPFTDPAEFLDAVARQESAVCAVLDLRMPGLGGLEVLDRLMHMRPDAAAVILSAHADVPSAVRGMKLGAVDVLQKPVEPQALLDCINGLIRLAGERFAAQARRRAVDARLQELSPREREVFEHLLTSASSKQIALDLDISAKTVDVHRANILRKLGAGSMRDLMQEFARPPTPQTQAR